MLCVPKLIIQHTNFLFNVYVKCYNISFFINVILCFFIYITLFRIIIQYIRLFYDYAFILLVVFLFALGLYFVSSFFKFALGLYFCEFYTSQKAYMSIGFLRLLLLLKFRVITFRVIKI